MTERQALIFQMYQDGMKKKDIASELDINLTTVYNNLNKCGITRASKGKEKNIDHGETKYKELPRIAPFRPNISEGQHVILRDKKVIRGRFMKITKREYEVIKKYPNIVHFRRESSNGVKINVTYTYADLRNILVGVVHQAAGQ